MNQKHNRADSYLRFERSPQPTPPQPRQTAPVRVVEETAKYRNAGAETNPIAAMPLNNGDAQTRAILRQIRDELGAK